MPYAGYANAFWGKIEVRSPVIRVLQMEAEFGVASWDEDAKGKKDNALGFAEAFSAISS
ncbi:hypothetical protein [Argonema antarcticum]|uniref:hypothetical protein n=1 Tax=Argonema antarcticum TaxID=2942763 RepID=UPI002011B3A1|nr:hypothetical protein [Argonema antarcticum]